MTTIIYELPLDTPDFIIQSSYRYSCSFWPFVKDDGTIEELRNDETDIGVWRIKYKHN